MYHHFGDCKIHTFTQLHEGCIMKIFALNKLAIACVAVATLIFGGITDVHAGGRSNKSGGGDKGERPSERTGSSKNEKHGDSGRAMQSADRRVADIERQIKEGNLNKKERRALEKKAQRIREDAQRKAKGEEHGRRAKR